MLKNRTYQTMHPFEISALWLNMKAAFVASHPFTAGLADLDIIGGLACCRSCKGQNETKKPTGRWFLWAVDLIAGTALHNHSAFPPAPPIFEILTAAGIQRSLPFSACLSGDISRIRAYLTYLQEVTANEI